MQSKYQTILIRLIFLLGISLNTANAVGIDELPVASESYAPESLEAMDYFVTVPDTRRWWSFLDLGFGESYWQHAGVYSSSDNFGSKSIIHALGLGVTVQETPASLFLKYNTNRIVWFKQDKVDVGYRNYALQTLREKVVNRVHYPANVEIPIMNPDGISLSSPNNNDKLYCSQLVHTVYDQLLASSVTGYTTVRPITPQDLVDVADKNTAVHHYSHPNFDDVLLGIGSIGSVRSNNIDNSNDEDWWNVKFEPGKKYTIETLPSSQGSMDTVLYLYRMCRECSQSLLSKIEVNDDGGSGQLSKIEYQAPSNILDIWSYKIMVRGYKNSTGSYKVTIKEDNQPDVSYKEKCDFIFDELEQRYSNYFPDSSTTRTVNSGHYRHYPTNGNYLYAYNDYLWYRINGKWYKSGSIESWYSNLSR